MVFVGYQRLVNTTIKVFDKAQVDDGFHSPEWLRILQHISEIASKGLRKQCWTV